MFFWIILYSVTVLYSMLLHLPPLRFLCVVERLDRTQDSGIVSVSLSKIINQTQNCVQYQQYSCIVIVFKVCKPSGGKKGPNSLFAGLGGGGGILGAGNKLWMP